MELVPFSVINQYLKERLIHPSRYTCSEYSFLKVFQHGLSFSLTKQKHKIIKNYLGYPFRVQMAIYYLKSLKGKKPTSYGPFKEYVILDPGRVVMGQDGKWHSIYFDKISKLIGKERLTILTTKEKAVIPFDYELDQLNGPNTIPDENEKRILKEIITVLHNARQSRQFTGAELLQIRSAMHVFYEEFRYFYNLFKGQPVKCLMFICHYHNEGLIAAVKMLNIKCVEVQHGLIASNDLYYVYHEQFASVIGKAMFPDMIMVYGPYWKRILETGCEFHSFQIHVAGDYLYRLEGLKKDEHKKENIVLICAQKNLHEDYVAYAKKLAEHLSKHPDWRGIVKLHPLEKNKDAYAELKNVGLSIVDIEEPLDELLSKSKIQISIYSTTFYDALGFDVINFSLQDFGTMSDYASDMINEGVAIPLLADEDPVEKFLLQREIGSTKVEREDVYGSFNLDIFCESIGLSEPISF
jgi:hypothetical protein